MNDITLSSARASYWQANGFGSDGGDSLEWVPLKLWKLTLRIPNTDGRRRAVRIHDLHHVVTGYGTTWTGEAEIAAWELATGCLRWPAAAVLNLGALAIGLMISPHRCARAWARGRATQNLYSEDGVEHLLPRTVSAIRAQLHLDRPVPRTRVRDVLTMTAVALPMLVLIAVLALPVLVLVATASAIAALR